MYDFISGPMVWISVGIFFVGMVVQTVRFVKETRARPREYQPQPQTPKTPKKAGPRPSLYHRLVRRYDNSVSWVQSSLLGSHPTMAVVTIVFHVLLIATPLFLLAHNLLIAESLGVALPSLPEGLSDFFTAVVLLCLGIFAFRRLLLRRVRAITSFYDLAVLLATAAPFVTGFIAYHQWLDYKTVLLLHMMSGELMLIIIPFTRLGHALFFFLYRFSLGSEYSFGQGRRAW